MHPLTTALGIAVLSCALNAQFVLPHDTDCGDRLNFDGPTGTSATHVIDLQALLSAKAGYTVNGSLGCTVDNLLGHYWVSFRRNTTSTANPHQLAEIWWDSTTSAWDSEVYDQPAGTSGSAWGIRDLTSGMGSNIMFIYGGCERSVTGNKVFAFNVLKSTTNPRRSIGWTPSADWKTDGVNGAISTIRGLAFHAGRGTMFTADFGSNVSEFKPDGTQVQTWAPTQNYGTYGMAYDPLRQTILAVGQSGARAATPAIRMVAYEFDPAVTGAGASKETGTIFYGADLTIPGTVPGGISGGCEIRVVKRKVESSTPGVFNTIDVPELIWVTQATADSMTLQYGRMQHHPYDGTGVAQPTNTGGDCRTGGGEAYIGNSGFKVDLANATGASNAILALSLYAHNIPFLGGTLSIDPNPSSAFTIVASVPVAGGSASLPLGIPNVTVLAGANVFFQWAQDNSGLSTAAGFTIQN